MTNVLATCTIIAKTALPVLENMLSFSMKVNRDYEDEFGGNMARGYAPGQTINIKKPPRYTYRAGRVSVPQATNETTVPLTLSQGGCDLNFTSQEQTISLTKLEDKIAAAIAPVANEIDRQGLALAHYSVFNALNTTGAQPATQLQATQVLTTCNQRLDEMGAPRDKRRTLISGPGLNANLVAGFAGLFNPQGKVNDQYRSGLMESAFGISGGMDQNVDIHANGAGTASNINGPNQIGSNITVAATGAGTITRGTVINLPGVFAVNPQSRQSTGVLAQWVITADVPVASTSLPISPPLVTTGPFQNASASPTNTTPFVIWGAASTSYSQNVAYHKDAFTLACVPLWAPEGGKGVIDVAQETNNGFTIKVTKFYDGVNDNAITRIDVLFGWSPTYPELAVRYFTV